MKLIQHSSPATRRYLDRHRAKLRDGAEHARFGVGGSCTPRMAPGEGYGTSCPPGPQIPGCVRPGRTCDVGRIGNTKVVAGGALFSMDITPKRLPWFQPLGIRAVVTDLGNSDLSHRVLITAVKVGGDAQLTVDNTNPTLPTAAGNEIDGFWSDDWIDPDGYAVPVNFAWCSNAANERQLTVYGATLGIAPATNVLVSISLYGNAAQQPS